jgi:hypothetical protein
LALTVLDQIVQHLKHVVIVVVGIHVQLSAVIPKKHTMSIVTMVILVAVMDGSEEVTAVRIVVKKKMEKPVMELDTMSLPAGIRMDV